MQASEHNPNAKPKRVKGSNRDDGYSIVAVTVFSVVAGAWMLMTASVSLPVIQKAAEFRYWSTVRSSAEAGLDYVAAQLDSNFKAGTVSSFDDTTVDGTAKVSAVPASVIGTYATVNVSVNNVRPPTTSSVYNTAFDDTLTNNSVGSVNRYRVISSTATYAGLSSTVRIIVRPDLNGLPATTTTTTTTTGPTSTSTMPFFNYAIFSDGAMLASGNMSTDAYDSRNGAYGGTNRNNYRGDVGSNTSATIGANSNIGGNLVVTSLPKGSTTAVVATRSANAVVQNQLKVNGVTSGFTGTNGPTPGGSDTVKALEFGTPRSGDYTTPIDKSLTSNQITLSPAPSAPSGAYNVGAINVSGNGKVIVRNNAAPVSSINVSANNTIYIPPGNYKATSLSISGNGQIQLESNVSTDVVISLEGNTAGSTVISLGGNGVSNATQIPSKFQVVTNSSKSTSITGNADFRGVIYAPSSPITIGGNGSVYGAIVGKQVTSTGNATVHFDLALADGTYANTHNLGATVTIPGQEITITTTTPTLVNSLKTVSWEER
ncbi:MAG: hypothetical protein K2Y22_01365 [Candidatus Obscuribacterales bacterium]|nr:hypothetical protein [Candidatus Obscuribacterales bacterium]